LGWFRCCIEVDGSGALCCRLVDIQNQTKPSQAKTPTTTTLPAGHASNLIWVRTCCSSLQSAPPLLLENQLKIRLRPALCVCVCACVLHSVRECISHLTYFRESESLSSISGLFLGNCVGSCSCSSSTRTSSIRGPIRYATQL